MCQTLSIAEITSQNLNISEATLGIKAVSNKDYGILLLAYALGEGALIGVG